MSQAEEDVVQCAPATYAFMLAEARTGRFKSAEMEVHAALVTLFAQISDDFPGYQRSDAFEELVELPFTIQQMVSDNRAESVVNPDHAADTQALVLRVHGADQYDFAACYEEEAAGKERHPTTPERLKGAPKLVFSILNGCGARPWLTNDAKTDPLGCGGIRLVVPHQISSEIC